MRNGMSVKEVYEKLDQLERLKTAYTDERQLRIDLEQVIMRLLCYILDTSKQYNAIGQECLDEKSFDDARDFVMKSQGILEAGDVLTRYLNEAGFNYIFDKINLA